MNRQQSCCAICKHMKQVIDFSDENITQVHAVCQKDQSIVRSDMPSCHKFESNLMVREPGPEQLSIPRKFDATWEQRRWDLVRDLVVAYYSNPAAPSKCPVENIINIADKVIEKYTETING